MALGFRSGKKGFRPCALILSQCLVPAFNPGKNRVFDVFVLLKKDLTADRKNRGCPWLQPRGT